MYARGEKGAHLFIAVVLADGLLDDPGAAEALGKGYEVALSDADGARGGLHRYVAFEEVAGFFGIVMPVEARGFFRPDRPGLSAQLLQSFLVRLFNPGFQFA